MDGTFGFGGQLVVQRITERWWEELALGGGGPLKSFKQSVMVSDGGEDVVDKGGIGTISNWCCAVIPVASMLVKGKTLLAEVKAIFGMALETGK